MLLVVEMFPVLLAVEHVHEEDSQLFFADFVGVVPHALDLQFLIV